MPPAAAATAAGRGPRRSPASRGRRAGGLAALMLAAVLAAAGCSGEDAPGDPAVPTGTATPGGPAVTAGPGADVTGTTGVDPAGSTAPGGPPSTTSRPDPTPPDPAGTTSTTSTPGVVGTSPAPAGRAAPDAAVGALRFTSVRVLPDPASGRFAVRAHVTNTSGEFANGVSVRWRIEAGGGATRDRGVFSPVSLAAGETATLNGVGARVYDGGWERVEFEME